MDVPLIMPSYVPSKQIGDRGSIRQRYQPHLLVGPDTKV
jgi:hypothetical protein